VYGTAFFIKINKIKQMFNRLIPACLLCFLCLACGKTPKRFTLLAPEQTGVAFNNRLVEYDTLNILNTEFIYNGGGTGIGDLNGDGLQDLIFTGNQVDNKLYLNKGNLRFEDISQQAGFIKKYPQEWSSGVNIVDLNLDGRQDVYICNTLNPDPEQRRNRLYVNQGNNAAGVPLFAEMAEAYHIDDTTHSSNAQFFDYDLDGDLDLFVSVNFMDTPNPNRYIKKTTDGTSVNRDKLYRNDWDSEAGHPVFTDVSDKAGIILEGYSHSALVSDFNDDGRPDLYVANDYVTNDLVYINQPDGTFKNRAADIFKHQAASAMGSDAADVNNDGLLDYFSTEMLPYYHKRKKAFLGPNMYSTYLNNDLYGYEYQYARNVLQLNRGTDPATGLSVFSDVGAITGTQETDWSWAPLMADFDNDGLRDIFVTNGFPRDVTDHDFSVYFRTYGNLLAPLDLQKQIPQVKVPKFMFHNRGDLRFDKVSKDWGTDRPAFSNGAAYGDLDNDGDLDLVVNNINDPAFIFKNTLNDGKTKPNFLRIRVKGPKTNPDAFGVEITAFFGGKVQKSTLLSARGYLSASENVFHLGLGDVAVVDSVVFRKNRLCKTAADQPNPFPADRRFGARNPCRPKPERPFDRNRPRNPRPRLYTQRLGSRRFQLSGDFAAQIFAIRPGYGGRRCERRWIGRCLPERKRPQNGHLVFADPRRNFSATGKQRQNRPSTPRRRIRRFAV
jgi:enediyne biosynthesis protein E4